MKIQIVIPARRESSRLNEKLLQKAGDKTVIEHTVDAASLTGYQVAVVSDCPSILKQCQRANIVWGSPETNNGTEKVRHYIRDNMEDEDIVVHWQADVPLMLPSYIGALVDLVKREYCNVSTLVYRSDDEKVYSNPNNVKALFDNYHNIMYFSRQRIPYNSPYCWIHTGIYCYKVKHLFKPRHHGIIERSFYAGENLEQLEWLVGGSKIMGVMCGMEHPIFNIDTQEDLDEFRDYLNRK